MLQARVGIFETNSSSADTFSHMTNGYVPSKFTFSITLFDELSEEAKNQLKDCLTGWLNKDYAKDTNIIKMENNENDDGTYTIIVEAETKLKLELAIIKREFYKTSFGQEPSYYYVDTHKSYISKATEDEIYDSLVDYAQSKDWIVPIIDITIKEEVYEKKNIEW